MAAEIEQARLTKPVHNKPNKRKQRTATVTEQPTKPTLWTKIKALLTAFAAK